MPPSEWHQFFALGVVPDGAVNMNVGVEYYQNQVTIMDRYTLMT